MGLRRSFKLTNLVTNGSFEIDSNADGLANSWEKSVGLTPSIADTHTFYDIKSQRMLGDAGATRYLLQSITLTTGKKYYFRVNCYNAVVLNNSGAYVILRSQTVSAGNIAAIEKPTIGNGMLSGIRTAVSDDNIIYLGAYDPSIVADVYWDGAGVIDLSNLPADILALSNDYLKAWCDLNIPAWFDGSLGSGVINGTGGLK